MLKRRGHKIGRVELFINAWKSSGEKVKLSPQVSLYKKVFLKMLPYRRPKIHKQNIKNKAI